MSDEELDALLTNAKPEPSTSGFLWFRGHGWGQCGLPSEIFDLAPDRHFLNEQAAMDALRDAVAKYKEHRK